MKKAILFFAFLLTTVSQLLAQGYHRVSGHYRSNGTYVQPYYRTNPNKTINDNWSTSPNVNPFTGKVGTIAPDNSTSTFSNTYNLPSQPNNTWIPSQTSQNNTFSTPISPSTFSSPTNTLTGTSSFSAPVIPPPTAAYDLNQFHIRP